MVQKAQRVIGFLLDDDGVVIGEQEEIFLTIATSRDGSYAGKVVGEVEVTNNPANDISTDWFFGAETSFSNAIAAGSETVGNFLDMSLANTASRTIVITTSGSSSIDYDYVVYFSTTGNFADAYASSLTGTAVATKVTGIPIPASEGIGLFCHLGITPDAAQASANRQFKASLSFKGG